MKSLFALVARVAALAVLALSAADLLGQVRLNEILANNSTINTADGKKSDYIELYNAGGTAVNLSNASLTDDPLVPRKWAFPSGVSLAAGQYLLVLLDSGAIPTTAWSAGQALNAGFGLSDRGDTLSLYAAPGAGGQLIDTVTFGLQLANHSLARGPDLNWTLMLPTPGAANTADKVVALGSVNTLRVNEFMADPRSGDDWFEIINLASAPVAMGGLSLTDNPTENPRLSPIPALSFIGTGEDAYIRFWADQNVAAGADHANFRLSANGETLAIVSGTGQIIDSIAFGPQQEGVSQGRFPNGTGLLMSFPGSPSPGEPNYTIYRNIVVNEVLSHTDDPREDAVEFVNVTSTPIDISGWYLSNKRSEPMRYRIPPNTVIPPNGSVVFYEYQFNGTGPFALSPFTFNSAQGDQVYLFQVNSSGQLTGARVEERFEAAANGVSFGRYGTSVPGDYKFVAMNQTTFGRDSAATLSDFRLGTGASNSYPRVGPIVISEIMYHPPDIGTNDNVLDEFIELRNISFASVPLYHPTQTTNKWRLQGGVVYDFPGNIVVPANGLLLVVNFDPATNATATAAWRAKHNVRAEAQVVGPYRGKLSNSSDEIELYRPDNAQTPPHPDAGFVPYIRVDKVNYSDLAPWPTGPDGTGQSLTRVNDFLFGNDPANWIGAAPTAGRANTNADNRDSDGDGMPDRFESAYQLHPRNAGDAALDPDNDGQTNLQEAQNGTNPRVADGQLRIEAILVAPVRIQFTAAAGKTYTVQYRDSLSSGSWAKLQDVSAGIRSRAVEVTDPAPNERMRFYRVVTPAQ